MFKFIIGGVILILLFFLLAEPAMTAGKRIAKKFSNIADDVEEE